MGAGGPDSLVLWLAGTLDAGLQGELHIQSLALAEEGEEGSI
jgi:hypothetical protein